ncbi:MAG: protein translocase subunit SecF, partial [Prevotella sp.]|nr:protein translocase subunit SecF [Prevotella sp.]
VFLTRLVYEYQLNHDRWMKLKFWTGISKNLMQGTNIKFMSMYKGTFVVTGLAVILFAGSFFVRGLAKSIDFTGGRNYVVQFEKPTQPEQVREALVGIFPGCTSGAISLGTDNKTIRISTNYKIESNSASVDDEVETMLYNGLKKTGMVSQKNVESFKNPDVRTGGSIISSSKVGPSVAKDVTYGAIVSVLIALVAIFLYILLRFRNVAFSLGSTIALAFDALTVIGIFSLLQGVMPFSLEVDQTFIGAVLTVIGYSINDKVVVFDRIRENLGLHPKEDIQVLFNDSINQTLARTINTSTTTLIVLIVILLLGGKSIQPFAFAMTIGVVFGTLSSIFIASPIAYLVAGKEIRNRRKAEAAEAVAVEVK